MEKLFLILVLLYSVASTSVCQAQNNPIEGKTFIDNYLAIKKTHIGTSNSQVLSAFNQKYGNEWYLSLTKFIALEKIKQNRRGFYDFYFNAACDKSIKADPRSAMFVRDNNNEAGKIELLLQTAIGIEGFANLMKKERIINPQNNQILVEGIPLKLDFGNYAKNADIILGMLSSDKVVWDDKLLVPSYEEAIKGVDNALELAKTAKEYDVSLLERMVAIGLCGAHCQTCPPSVPPYSMLNKEELVYKMYGVLMVSAAIRNATNDFVKSIK